MAEVPVRVTAYLDTRLDPATNLPVVMLSATMAELESDGKYHGRGVKTLTLDFAQQYQLINPITRSPDGTSIDGSKALAVILGLINAAQDN